MRMRKVSQHLCLDSNFLKMYKVKVIKKFKLLVYFDYRAYLSWNINITLNNKKRGSLIRFKSLFNNTFLNILLELQHPKSFENLKICVGVIAVIVIKNFVQVHLAAKLFLCGHEATYSNYLAHMMCLFICSHQ